MPGMLKVKCTPTITDPSEFNTVLASSLRSLFGEMETHSFGMEIVKNDDHDDQEEDEDPFAAFDFVVTCDKKSIAAIQAALTMPTLPNYMDEYVVFCFDTKVEAADGQSEVKRIKNKSHNQISKEA